MRGHMLQKLRNVRFYCVCHMVNQILPFCTAAVDPWALQDSRVPPPVPTLPSLTPVEVTEGVT